MTITAAIPKIVRLMESPSVLFLLPVMVVAEGIEVSDADGSDLEVNVLVDRIEALGELRM